MNHSIEYQEIVSGLGRLDTWEDRYSFIIKLGQALPTLVEAEKTEANRVHACVARVWLVPSAVQRNGQVEIDFRGDSDAMIVRGLVALLLSLYSGRPGAEIAAIDAAILFEELGLRGHLSAQRTNGLLAMITRMRAIGREASARKASPMQGGGHSG